MQIDEQIDKNPVRKHRKDVGCQLIAQIAALVGPDYIVKITRERSWASVTFSGTRHSVAIGPALNANTPLPSVFAAQIAEHEFDLPGRFVADVLLDDRKAQSGAITAEILTIIDPVTIRT